MAAEKLRLVPYTIWGERTGEPVVWLSPYCMGSSWEKTEIKRRYWCRAQMLRCRDGALEQQCSISLCRCRERGRQGTRLRATPGSCLLSLGVVSGKIELASAMVKKPHNIYWETQDLGNLLDDRSHISYVIPVSLGRIAVSHLMSLKMEHLPPDVYELSL